MPYSPELRRLIEEAELWADLRHEQGVDVSSILDNPTKDIEKTVNRLMFRRRRYIYE